MNYAPLPNTLIVGIGSKARQGKDLAARILIEHAPKLVRRFAFADALYAHCRTVHGMTRKDPALLQRAGVNGRLTDLEMWIRPVYWAIADAEPAIAVITDVRFENEAAFVRSMGGLLFNIERRDLFGERYVANDRDPQHSTETALDGFAWDATIENPYGEPIDEFEHNVLAGIYLPALAKLSAMRKAA